MQRRIQKELRQLSLSPPDGVVCYALEDDLSNLEAKMEPMEGTPYWGGVFRVSLRIGDRYPHEPPNVRFITPIYHPNIDSEGRVCLNLLKMPPKGCWSPSYGISAVLSGLQILLAQPNADDPLMADITEEYRSRPDEFLRKATQYTEKYAKQDKAAAMKEPPQHNDDDVVEKRKESAVDISCSIMGSSSHVHNDIVADEGFIQILTPVVTKRIKF